MLDVIATTSGDDSLGGEGSYADGIGCSGRGRIGSDLTNLPYSHAKKGLMCAPNVVSFISMMISAGIGCPSSAILPFALPILAAFLLSST